MLVEKGKRGEKSIWQCDWCGKKFAVPTTKVSNAIKRNYKKFCSKECKHKYWSKRASKRVTNWVKENGHPQLKKGSGITTDGYVWVYAKGRGYCHNQIKLHRYLMEIKLGRRLKSTEIVHHIDENKFNNNIDNLKIVTRSEHNKIHGFLTKEVR